MTIRQRLNQQTDTRLLLEETQAVDLPPAEIEEKNVIVQFDTFKLHIPELLEALRAGTIAEPVPVMLDGSTFMVHGETRTFWVKLWHSSAELTRIERVQVISCLPSTRGVRVIAQMEEDDYDDEDDALFESGDAEEDERDASSG